MSDDDFLLTKEYILSPSRESHLERLNALNRLEDEAKELSLEFDRLQKEHEEVYHGNRI